MGNIPYIFYLSKWIVLFCMYIFYKHTIRFNNNTLFKRNLKYFIAVTKFIFLIMNIFHIYKVFILHVQLVFTAS